MAPPTIFPVYLTPQRRTLLQAISDFADIHGYAPTVRELRETMGYASVSTVHTHLTILRDEHAVDWVDGQARTLHMTASGRRALAERVL